MIQAFELERSLKVVTIEEKETSEAASETESEQTDEEKVNSTGFEIITK